LTDADARAELHTLQLGVAWLDHASTRAPMHVWRAIEEEIRPEADRVIIPLASRRRVHRWRVAVAAAVMFVIVGAGTIVGRQRTHDASTVAPLAATASTQPGSETAALRAADGTRAGTVVVTRGGDAYLVWSRAPAEIRTSGTYQLWGLAPDGPRSAGL